MLRFQHIEYLWILSLIPVLIVLYLLRLQWRSIKLRKLGDPSLIQNQLSGRISGRMTTKFVLIMLSLTTAIFGLANIRKGAETESAARKGVDVFFALDVSKSMLARDVQPDRITRAKQLISRMMSKMNNDRVGLVVFAGRSYLQVPLTVDYGAAQMLLESVNPDMIPTQGTVLAEAIRLSSESFSQKERKYKALVLISDGEDHDTKARDEAKIAAESGLVIYTVGIGSPEGSTLFDPATGSDKLDESGNPVISKLNEQELRELAHMTGGHYQRLGNTNTTADNLLDVINNMEGRNIDTVYYTNYMNYFQYFIGIALILLMLEWLVPLNAVVKRP